MIFDLFQILRNAGAIGLVQVILAMIAVVLGGYRCFVLVREHFRLDECHSSLREHLIAQRWEIGSRECSDCFMRRGYQEAIKYRKGGRAVMRDVLKHYISLDFDPEIEFGVALLSRIAVSCTSIGLLGTVYGMSLAFLDVTALGNQSQLAADINVSLSTTVLGLVISIPLGFGILGLQALGVRLRRGVEQHVNCLVYDVFGPPDPSPVDPGPSAAGLVPVAG